MSQFKKKHFITKEAFLLSSVFIAICFGHQYLSLLKQIRLKKIEFYNFLQPL